MENLSEFFNKFLKNIKDDNNSESEDSLQLATIFNNKLLKDLQNNIKNYAKVHIKNFSKNQDYNKLKKIHNSKNLFVDNEFPPKNSSVFHTNEFRNWLIKQNRLSRSGNVIWKRAKEINQKAQIAADKNGNKCDPLTPSHNLIRNCFNSSDLNQGYVGNCWFVAAATGIIENTDLVRKIIPFDNYFSHNEYCGLFHFRFWIYGTWYDVCIDDYLPVGSDGRLNFCHNKHNNNEFWCALLEKAYAKVNGSYESLEGGFTTSLNLCLFDEKDALVDMSGGVEELFELKKLVDSDNKIKKEDSDSFWSILMQARRKKSVICCNIEPDEKVADLKLPNGLIKGHAYVVTTLASVPVGNKEVHLLKCHNPWGTEIENKGNWSKSSKLWASLPKSIRKELMQQVKKQGQFWMSYTDWLLNFDVCQIVNLAPESVLDNNFTEQEYQNLRLLCSLYSTWHCYTFHSSWEKYLTSGGRGEKNKEKYWINPQFLLIITKCDIVSSEGYATLIISLLQKENRKKRLISNNNSSDEYIQFRLYQITNKEAVLKCFSTGEQIDAKHLKRIGSSGAYLNKREVTRRFNLPPGEYVIIPSTYDEDIEGKFLLRIFSEKPLNNLCSEIDENNQLKRFFSHVKILLQKYIHSTQMKKSEMESKSVTNLKIINSSYDLFLNSI